MSNEAFVVPAGELPTAGADTAALTERLRAWLRSRLPDYMVPAAIQVLPVLPLTGNGKIDRRALTSLAAHAGDSAARAAAEPPRTDEEQRMAALWAEVLRLPTAQIGLQENFFHLGGHSLLATQLVSRIRSTFAVEMPLRQLFECPTVGELARLVAATGATADDSVEMEEGEL